MRGHSFPQLGASIDLVFEVITVLFGCLMCYLLAGVCLEVQSDWKHLGFNLS